MSQPLIRNVSDTARWVAVYRARETDRPDALFRDPFAGRLAGERGEQIASALPEGDRTQWAWVTRTYLFDHFIREEVRRGVDMVINLAAGLDARPYRMELPASLRWVEVDLPEILTYKEGILAAEKPVCALERVHLDLADGDRRRELFARLGKQARKALVITEGLVVYLTADQVGALARALAAEPAFERWITDLMSPGLLDMLKKNWNPQLSQGDAPLKFAPEEGPEFFTAHGWKPVDVRSTLKTAARLKRAPFFLRIIALLPDSKGRQGSRPWSATVVLARR
jgi:methyltransferase (TIGR00027 family)